MNFIDNWIEGKERYLKTKQKTKKKRYISRLPEYDDTYYQDGKTISSIQSNTWYRIKS